MDVIWVFIPNLFFNYTSKLPFHNLSSIPHLKLQLLQTVKKQTNHTVGKEQELWLRINVWHTKARLYEFSDLSARCGSLVSSEISPLLKKYSTTQCIMPEWGLLIRSCFNNRNERNNLQFSLPGSTASVGSHFTSFVTTTFMFWICTNYLFRLTLLNLRNSFL
jgi:hypothetical protein